MCVFACNRCSSAFVYFAYHRPLEQHFPLTLAALLLSSFFLPGARSGTCRFLLDARDVDGSGRGLPDLLFAHGSRACRHPFCRAHDSKVVHPKARLPPLLLGRTGRTRELLLCTMGQSRSPVRLELGRGEGMLSRPPANGRQA